MKLRVSDEDLDYAKDKLEQSLTTSSVYGVNVYDLILDLKEARAARRGVDKDISDTIKAGIRWLKDETKG